VRRGWTSLGALFILSGAALPACDDSTPAERGFDSRQILATRDPSLVFYYARGNLVFYVTGLDASGQGTATFSTLDIETGDTTNYGATMPDLSALFPPDGAPPAPRYKCHFDTAADGVTQVFIIEDTLTGAATDIDNAVWTSPYCPVDADPSIRVWRGESDGTYSLWAGPYTDLQPMPLPLVVHRVLWHETGSRWLVAAPSPTAPAGLGVYALAEDDPTAATEIVAAELGPAAWAAGATPSTALASSGLTGNSYFWPATSGQVYSYERAMADGSTVMFVGPYDDATAREQALFPVAADSGLELLRIEPYNFRYDGKWPLTTAWASLEGPSKTETFRIWRDASRGFASCTWAGDRQPVARADPPGESALFVNPASCCSFLPNSALLLMVPNAADGNPCRVLAPDDVGFADFSPDGTAMAWLVEAPDVKQQLWTAARDGSGAREIGEGLIAGTFDLITNAPHFVGDSQLELTLDEGLVWVDVHDDPVHTHYITERTFGVPIDLGRWVVTGHDHSNQDSSGPLALVNRDTGATRAISPGVTMYTSPDVPLLYTTRTGKFNDDGSPIRIVYVVRGRNPSAQDGIWVATITAQDRQ
jgi:hypothetical protein